MGFWGWAHAQAQDAIADFYKGKQLRIIVASSSGGGFDLYGRFVSRYLGKHIPGHPTVIVQNMPGAGGLAAANHLYTRAEKDGLTIGIIQGPLTYAQVGKSSNVQFDMTKFGWLGSANVTSDVCVFSKRVVHRQADRPAHQTDHHRRLRRLDRIQPEPAQRAGRDKIQAGQRLRVDQQHAAGDRARRGGWHVRLGLGQRAGGRARLFRARRLLGRASKSASSAIPSW